MLAGFRDRRHEPVPPQPARAAPRGWSTRRRPRRRRRRTAARLENPGAERFDVGVDVPGAVSASVGRAEQAGVTRLELRLPALRRGRLQVPRLRVATTFPFGLFPRCWTWVHLPLEVLVYPRPAGERPAPPGGSGREGGNAAEDDAGRDELRDLRPFRDGDSPRQVAWKAYARGQPLLVRIARAAPPATLEFDFATLMGLDTEARLSQLCRWLLDADARGQRYALRLPDGAFAADRGIARRARCLAALALTASATMHKRTRQAKARPHPCARPHPEAHG